MAADSEDIFRSLSADDHEVAPMEIESLCVSCEKNGTTRLMCISIPYYKAVILMSFECPHCDYRNNEIQSGEAVQEHGTEIVLRVQEQSDLCRQLVKSEYAIIEVPELELTIPSKSQAGEVTTVESVLQRVSFGLSHEQEKRRELDPESAEKIESFLTHLKSLLALEQKWTLKLRDPTGNCFIQNPDPRHVDPRCIVSHYHRSLEEIKLLGLADDDALDLVLFVVDLQQLRGCFQLQKISYRHNQHSLSVTALSATKRGSSQNSLHNLMMSVFLWYSNFLLSDSLNLSMHFLKILSLRKVATLVLDDPAGNSYIQSLAAPLEDPRLVKDFYERNYEQNEELGLNDMKRFSTII
uniref:Zpr1 domain-containing protein n=1 Tax=Heterorhabditis bacteriophora TaxID=37862 RepID=A0A1I7XKF8_HETBA